MCRAIGPACSDRSAVHQLVQRREEKAQRSDIETADRACSPAVEAIQPRFLRGVARLTGRADSNFAPSCSRAALEFFASPSETFATSTSLACSPLAPVMAKDKPGFEFGIPTPRIERPRHGLPLLSLASTEYFFAMARKMVKREAIHSNNACLSGVSSATATLSYDLYTATRAATFRQRVPNSLRQL